MDYIANDLLPRLEDVCEDLEVDQEAPEEVEALLEELKEYIDHAYKRPEGMYSKIRRLAGERITHPATLQKMREVVRMSKEGYLAEKMAAKLVLEHRNANQTVFSIQYVREVVERLKAGGSFADRVLLLMLACGARKIEILDRETSMFYPTGNSHTIAQVGVAKKRKTEKEVWIDKPLLFVDSFDFLVHLSLVRIEVDKRDKESREAIGKTFSHQLEKLSAYHWPQNVANGYRTGTHVNRAVYVNVAYRKLKNKGESLTHFIKEKLGHESMGSAANYMNISISFDAEDELADEAKEQQQMAMGTRVALINKDGKRVLLPRCAIRKLTRSEREAVAVDFGRLLHTHDIDVTRANLMSLGIQSPVVTSSGVLNMFPD